MKKLLIVLIFVMITAIIIMLSTIVAMASPAYIALIKSQPLEIQKIIKIESSFRPWVVSSQNCVGLMQCSKYVLADYNKKHRTNYRMKDLKIPRINIMIGRYLAA